MIFTGYDTHHPKRTYRILNRKTQRIVHFRDIMWMKIMIGDYLELKKGGNDKFFTNRIFDKIDEREEVFGDSGVEISVENEVPVRQFENERHVQHGTDV